MMIQRRNGAVVSGTVAEAAAAAAAEAEAERSGARLKCGWVADDDGHDGRPAQPQILGESVDGSDGRDVSVRVSRRYPRATL